MLAGGRSASTKLEGHRSEGGDGEKEGCRERMRGGRRQGEASRREGIVTFDTKGKGKIPTFSTTQFEPVAPMSRGVEMLYLLPSAFCTVMLQPPPGMRDTSTTLRSKRMSMSLAISGAWMSFLRRLIRSCLLIQ